jgi:RHS repeat-associated protein
VGDAGRGYVYGVGLAYSVALNNPNDIEVYHTDVRGSVRAITNSDGTPLQVMRYDPYGETQVYTNAGLPTPIFGFAGQQVDPETGLSFMNARYYDTSTGRFLSRDTVFGDAGSPVSLNRYAYAGGNPVSNVDSGGHWFVPWNGSLSPLGMPSNDPDDPRFFLTFGRAIGTAAGAMQAAQGLLSFVQQRANPVINVSIGIPQRIPGQGAVLPQQPYGLSHALFRHFNAFAPRDRSIFAISPFNIPELISTAEQFPAEPAGVDRFVRVVDTGRTLGWDFATRSLTSIYHIWTDGSNEFQSMAPGLPWSTWTGTINVP